MNTKKALIYAAVMSAAMGLSASAPAYEQGDWIIRAGAAMVDPDTDSDPIILPDLANPGGTIDLNQGIDVDDDTQLGITGTYMLTNIWAIELLAATPFEHDFSVEDLSIDGGSTKHLPPTLTFNWYPRGGKDGIQPFVGVGVNYTYFWDEEISGELETTLDSLGLTGSDLSLESSWGVAGRAGVDYPINDNWGVSASLWWIDIDTEAEIDTDVGTVDFDVELDPWVYMVGISYKF